MEGLLKNKLTKDHIILINRIKYLYHLNYIFNNESVNNMIDDFKEKNVFVDIDKLEDCQKGIKPTTIYLGSIKRSNDTFKNNLM